MRNADIERAEREQRVVDAVAGQDGDRPLRRELAREQRGADGARFVPRLRIGDRTPGAVGIALGHEDAVGRDLRPVIETLGDLVGVGAKRLRRTQDQRAVGAALDRHVLRAEPHGADRRIAQFACGFAHDACASAMAVAGSGTA